MEGWLVFNVYTMVRRAIKVLVLIAVLMKLGEAEVLAAALILWSRCSSEEASTPECGTAEGASGAHESLLGGEAKEAGQGVAPQPGYLHRFRFRPGRVVAFWPARHGLAARSHIVGNRRRRSISRSSLRHAALIKGPGSTEGIGCWPDRVDCSTKPDSKFFLKSVNPTGSARRSK